MPKTYAVELEYTYRYTTEVEADNEDEAKELAVDEAETEVGSAIWDMYLDFSDVECIDEGEDEEEEDEEDEVEETAVTESGVFPIDESEKTAEG